MRKGGYSGGSGIVTNPTRGVVKPHSSIMNTYNADLIVASIGKDVVILKDTYYDLEKQRVLEAICRLVSRYVFGKRYKLFVPAFEEDMKQAIDGVIDKHHLKKMNQKGD